jgi:sugar phosphate isomerase/epimerase
MSNMRKIMWNGTVRALPLAGQLRAASIAGCEALSVTPFSYVKWLAASLTTRDMVTMAADAGIRITHLDPLLRWITRWKPNRNEATFPYDALSFDQNDFFRFAQALGVTSFTAWIAPVDLLSFDEIVDDFGNLCLRAAGLGLRCDLEFIPMYGIPNLETAWNIVKAVNAPNSGIVFDFWHYSRGKPDDQLLRTIPGDKITAVQLCDGTAELAPGISLIYDGQKLRQPPGEGGFRVKEIVGILRDIGGLNNVGPEIFSERFDTMTAEDIGLICRTSLDAALAARPARAPH